MVGHVNVYEIIKLLQLIKYEHIIFVETGWTTEMALVISSCGMMSFGWGMSVYILFFQKVIFHIKFKITFHVLL